MKIPKRIAQALINSLKGGVVPRVGLQYVAVGRKEEIDALLRDVEIVADGGASFRVCRLFNKPAFFEDPRLRGRRLFI